MSFSSLENNLRQSWRAKRSCPYSLNHFFNSVTEHIYSVIYSAWHEGYNRKREQNSSCPCKVYDPVRNADQRATMTTVWPRATCGEKYCFSWKHTGPATRLLREVSLEEMTFSRKLTNTTEINKLPPSHCCWVENRRFLLYPHVEQILIKSRPKLKSTYKLTFKTSKYKFKKIYYLSTLKEYLIGKYL